MFDDDIIVRYVPLPICVEGVTIPHIDGTYNIYVNSNYSAEYQRKILKHELRHVNNSDFEGFDDIRTIENNAKG